MATRKIIKIDENLCTGCGLCIPNCPEGALQVIDGKARLISDLFCDGLGACIGHCPEGAIIIEHREAEPYNERKVMNNIIKAGKNTILAHLNHLKDHGEHTYLNEALSVLKERNIIVPFNNEREKKIPPTTCKCPSSQMKDFSKEHRKETKEQGTRISHLRQWPVQLHLVPPNAPYFQNKNVLLVADCVAYSLGDFHKQYLQGNSLTIACPKLDTHQEQYLEKLTAMIDEAKITTLTVMIMEVPCCRGLLALAMNASSNAKRKIPIQVLVIGIKGEILKKESL
ncbi:MAG: 4Fe-4S binding protein [Methanobacteriota archaeon]